METPDGALRRLRDSAAELAEVCADRGAILLTVFGSVLRPEADPHDLDLAVLFDRGAARDVLGLRDSLVSLARFEGIDLAVLNGAGPVIRERALVDGEVLYEATPSVHANAAVSATLERMDTEWLRRLAVQQLAL